MNFWLRCAVVAMLPCSVLAASGCYRSAPESYLPGLGEIMTATQMRHSKLWFAGEAGNWPLAAYELEELKEGFDDAVRFHPAHKGVPISTLLPQMTEAPLAQLDGAIEAGNVTDFGRAFDTLTAGCNACHQAAHFAFNVVTRPSSNPVTNQRFEVTNEAGPAR